MVKEITIVSFLHLILSCFPSKKIWTVVSSIFFMLSFPLETRKVTIWKYDAVCQDVQFQVVMMISLVWLGSASYLGLVSCRNDQNPDCFCSLKQIFLPTRPQTAVSALWGFIILTEFHLLCPIWVEQWTYHQHTSLMTFVPVWWSVTSVNSYCQVLSFL